MKKIGLLPRILIAIALGIGAGFVLPEWAGRIFATFNEIFSEFLSFIIPLLILGLVAPAIADLGKSAGRMLVVTVAIAYVMSVAVGLFTYGVSCVTFPGIVEPGAVSSAPARELTPFFGLDIPPVMTVMTALVLAFTLGLGAARLEQGGLRRGLDDLRKVIVMVIGNVLIPLLPLYIFGIFMGIAYSGTAGTVITTFAGIIGVIIAMQVVVLVLQFTLASLFSGLNPLKALWRMMPAYFTALGTQSSAATIPVTLRQTVSLGVDPNVAGFTVPLCATIHMSGSIMKIVSCSIAILMLSGGDYSFGLYAGFIAMLAITIVAAPGVPGGAIMASLGLLSSMLGFSDADNALMIAIYIAIDSFGTACNVTGDAAITQIVDRIFRGKPIKA